MIEEQQFVLFISGIQHYFKQTCNVKVEVMPPYILDNRLSLLDYTGVVSVSGNYPGKVYFSAEKNVLQRLLIHLGEPNTTNPSILSDVVGEVANTLSGNFRREYGQKFEISPPSVYREPIEVRYEKNRATYVVPLLWGPGKASLVVDFQR